SLLWTRDCRKALRLEKRLKPNNSFRTFRVAPGLRVKVFMWTGWQARGSFAALSIPMLVLSSFLPKDINLSLEKSDSTCMKPNLPTKGIVAPSKFCLKDWGFRTPGLVRSPRLFTISTSKILNLGDKRRLE